MKPFNFVIALFLVIILGGFIFFKDGFNQLQQNTRAAESQPHQVLMDRMQYLDYSDQNLKTAEKFGKTVLFFAATTWCSNCAALDADIKKRVSELPSNVTILKVDYDSDRETKAKYGITMQTTLVLLDGNGKEMKRWTGSSFDNLVQNLN